jgi:hypothetical protein
MRARPLTTLGAGVVALAAVSASAQTPGPPTIADIATCNEMAAARTGDPSALARPRPPAAPETPGRRDTGPTEGDARSDARPPAPRGGPALDPPSGSAAGQKTDPSGSIITQSPDPLLVGMDAERAADPAYRTAYRRCMQERAERAR